MLPANLAARYEAAESDDKLPSSRGEVALLQTRLADLVHRLASGESSDRWAKLIKCFDQFDRAASAGDHHKLGTLVMAARRIVRQGAREEDIWRDIFSPIERKPVVAAREGRRIAARRPAITVEQAIILITNFTEIVKRNVTDRTSRNRISREVNKLIGPNHRRVGDESY